MPARQIRSSATLVEFGCYDYFPISLEEAITWLSKGEYYSTLRSRDMCYALHELTGRAVYPLYGAPTPPLCQGEEALVYYVPLSETIRSVNSMPRDYMLGNYQLGLLKRVDVVATPLVTEEKQQDGTETPVDSREERQES